MSSVSDVALQDNAAFVKQSFNTEVVQEYIGVRAIFYKGGGGGGGGGGGEPFAQKNSRKLPKFLRKSR